MACANRQGCGSCALAKGEAANLEPWNHLKARLCVLGGIPFFCHDGQPWREEELHRGVSRKRFQEQNFKICAGWASEVNALAKVGYFHQGDRLIKRCYAILGMEAVDEFCSPKSPERKKQALKQIRDITTQLNKKARSFVRKIRRGGAN